MNRLALCKSVFVIQTKKGACMRYRIPL